MILVFDCSFWSVILSRSNVKNWGIKVDYYNNQEMISCETVMNYNISLSKYTNTH